MNVRIIKGSKLLGGVKKKPEAIASGFLFALCPCSTCHQLPLSATRGKGQIACNLQANEVSESFGSSPTRGAKKEARGNASGFLFAFYPRSTCHQLPLARSAVRGKVVRPCKRACERVVRFKSTRCFSFGSFSFAGLFATPPQRSGKGQIACNLQVSEANGSFWFNVH